MTWAGRRDPPAGDMTPPAYTPSPSGARSKRVTGMFLYCKACRKCDSTEKRGEEAEEHEVPKNFEGSSKSMEASAILKMVEDTFYNRFLIVEVIVSDDDSTMRDVIKHPSIGAQGQVLK